MDSPRAGRARTFDVSEHRYVVVAHEIDSDTFAAKASATTDPVDVIFPVGRKIVVYDKRNLLDINSTGQKVSGDKHASTSSAEFFHQHATLFLIHITMLIVEREQR